MRGKSELGGLLWREEGYCTSRLPCALWALAAPARCTSAGLPRLAPASVLPKVTFSEACPATLSKNSSISSAFHFFLVLALALCILLIYLVSCLLCVLQK